MGLEETDNCKYLNKFRDDYSGKYKIINDSPLGSGGYANVYKGKDVARNIDVAIKIYNDGIAPVGAARDWVISSVVNHHQIAHTYTIEDFLVEGKCCKAVVSRFIPGRSLAHIFNQMNDLPKEMSNLIATDFANSLVLSTLEILSCCHALGYGHGDLTPNNVMVNWTDYGEHFSTVACLIDFDNAVVKSSLVGNSNKDKMASDYRALRRVLAQLYKIGNMQMHLIFYWMVFLKCRNCFMPTRLS